ncbi:hypothetical protein B0O99DRAFT_640663, partial [Bisporella sp. PMI_857]
MDPGTIISVLEILSSVVKSLVEAGQTIHDAPEGLFRVVRETEKLRALMDRLLIFQKGLSKEQQGILDGQVSTVGCKDILKELSDLTSGKKFGHKDGVSGGEMKLADRWWWLRKKDVVEGLVKRLEDETERISRRLVNEYLFKQSQELSHSSEQINRIMELVISITLKLNSDALKAPLLDDNGVFSPYIAEGISWYGQYRCKPGQDLSMPYFRDRYALANAAWAGDWNTFKRLLDHARSAYRQNWINCTSIYKATDQDSVTSGFRPLHQAAWHGDKSALEYLMNNGAWRLARTMRHTRSSSKYSTPLDIARAHGWKDLYENLNPVIRRPVSHKVLQTLQSHLDSLIKEQFESHPNVHLDCFLLPELEILTEFDRSRLWFPLNPELLDTRDGF